MISTAAFRKLALSFHDVVEQPHFEKTSFRINKKIFATLDIVKKKGVVKISKDDQSLFCEHHPDIIYPANGAWGKQGWTIIDLAKAKIKIIKTLLAISYEMVSIKKSSKSKPKKI
ncbi:MAG: MmcQ/YjbR family DNA-binding protein [Cyclobacteriaceae bacterium]|nr:MmcQ/YjbR family DNA-binding protein [Cyclobacteriaceae bacterium]